MRARSAKHRLPARIARQAGSNAAAQAAMNPVTGGAASPGGVPMTMPLQQVIVQQTSDQYVTVGSQELEPIWAPDGETIPATGSGRWGQLIAAGNPHPRAQLPIRAPIAARSAQRGRS